MNAADFRLTEVSSNDKNLEDSLKRGYTEMSPINLKLAEEAVQADNDALFLSEQNVRSVKMSDS